ncbi:hypothetical protein CALCODRAFT_524606 [Calocera cornea HHB12733]|uniref:RING-type domain-containing protein n=1 Tax=Calocera cornea HHB12733 TaxID=1353952 RepID=A0A165ENN8_9BASI|nr:hypothetical protein CALCODRAFT_524606 [Calocera cornea HHB12733]
MTRSHSKNNTASSVFTYAEHQKLSYGTQRQRLGADSMRAFSACALCLSRAREPVCCGKGHLYCRECVLEDLVKQKRDIGRWEKRRLALAREEEREREKKAAEARERVLREFERRQTGLGRSEDREPPLASTRTERTYPPGWGGSHPILLCSDPMARAAPRGVKRKLDFDFAQEAASLAAAAEAAALRAIEAEQAEARRAKLPDFWLPSLTPAAAQGRMKEGKLETVCRAGEPAHRLTLKSLIPVLFTVERVAAPQAQSGSATPAQEGEAVAPGPGKASAGGEEDAMIICPSCKKTLGGTSLVCVIKRCGHVLCKSCVGELVTPSGQCVVCDGRAGTGDVVELNREGTGYAAGGRAETSVKGVAFQG